MTYSSLWRPGTPALVMLHGTGGDKEGFAALGAEIAPGAGVLALDGDVMEHGARRFFRRRAEGVYDMDDLGARTAALDAFLSAALAEHGIGAAVGIGYSNGANILANLALTGSRRLARLVLMHPLIPFEPDWPDLSGVSVTITAGERDPIAPPAQTRRLAEGFAAAGAEVQTVWHPGGHEMRPTEIEAARLAVNAMASPARPA